MVSPNPASSAGGVERVCALLAGMLEADGWRVTVVGPQRGMKRWQFWIGAGYLGISRSATRAAHHLNPDLLITNGLLGMGSSRKVPRVHVFHGTMVGDTRAEGDDISRRERVRRTFGGGVSEALAGRGATVVCVSESTANEVRKYYRLRTDAVIPNGVDTRVFAPRPLDRARQFFGLEQSARYCLFVGRMQHRKGSELLLPACRAAGYELLIAGATGVPGAHHLGILTPNELAEAYAAADCVLFPTRYEGFGLAGIEALACGRPLLMTNVGWMTTFLRAVPEYGQFCIRPERDDIVAHLRIVDAVEMDQLTEEAREWVVMNNSLERWAQQWRELIDRCGTRR